MKDGNKNLIAVLSLTLISIIIHHRWFFNLNLLTYGDWGFLFNETMNDFLSLPLAWNSFSGFGHPETTPSFYPILLLYAILSKLGLNYAISERIIFMWPAAILPMLCSFFLVKKVTNSFVGGFAGALAYSLSSYYCVIKTGHLTVGVAYSLAPLVLLCFMISLEKISIRYSVATGLLLCLAGIYEFRIAYIITCILFFYWTFWVISQRKWRVYLSSLPFLIIPCAILFSLNAYWLLNIFIGTGTKDMGFLNRGLFGEGYLNLLTALTNFHPFWTGKGQTPFIVQPIPIFSWFIPILAFGALLFKEKNKNILFFAILAFIGITLTKQSAPPFPSLYLWLYDHFPGFNAFREASKFYLVIALAYCVLIGYTITKMHEYFKLRHKIFHYVIVCVVSALFLWNAKPFVTGEVGTIFIPKDVPQEYVALKDFLYKNNKYYRTLWIPRASRYAFYSQNHPFVLMTDLIEGPWRELSGSGSYVERMKKVLSSGYAKNQMKACKIKYIVLPTDPENDTYIHYGAPRDEYQKILDALPWLQSVDAGTGDLIVYRYIGYNS